MQDTRRVVDWAHYDPALCCQLPEASHTSQTVCQIDKAVVTSVDISSNWVPALIPDYQDTLGK